MKTKTTDKPMTLRSFALAAFPDYRGRKIRLAVREGGLNLTSSWSEGSREYFKIVEIGTMKRADVPESGNGYTKIDRQYGPGAMMDTPMPAPGFAVVAHSIFCGRDCGLTVYIHPKNAAALLTEAK